MTRLHAALIVLGALSVGLASAALAGVPHLAPLAEGPIDFGSLLAPVSVGFAALLFALQYHGFVFYWRAQSTKISLDEIGIFVGLLALPPAALVLAVVASSLVNQLVHRRELGKSAFNVAQYAIAALVTVLVCVALRIAGVPSPWFALPSPLLFYALTAFQVSLLFAQSEGVSPFRVFRQRFGRFVVLGATLGASLGLVVLALFKLHPLAVVAAVPLFVYLRRFGRLSEWAEAEITTHRLVASVSAEVAGRADLDRVADRILATCHDLFDCGEAVLMLARGTTAEPRVWRASFGKSLGVGGVTAEICDADGSRLGSLQAFPKPGANRYGEREQQLLRTVAASAAAAAANADALRSAKEANRRLENMNRELEQFTLWTTHDMREPLRSIGTIATLLHEDLGNIETEEARDLARRICEGSDRLKERVKALHAFSLIVQRDDEFEDVDMQRVMEHVVASLEARISEKRATIVFPPGDFPTIRAQPHRIDQVFGNLVENALKYGRQEDALVEVGFSQTPTEWRFFVRDDGPGIPAGYQERIFQLFQRGPGAKETGSGAGLAIVKRIAEQHGGRAWVESREGEGACFVVALPKPTTVLVKPAATLERAHKAF